MANQITDENFEEEVIKSDIPVLVDFFAEWCGPCQAMIPIIDELAEEYKGKAKIVKMNTDSSAETAQKFGIMSIPTLILFEKGEVKEQMMGVQEKESIKQKLDSII